MIKNPPGVIYNRPRARQLHNFNGLVYGKISPTNIDGLIDFHGKCRVVIESKYKDYPLPYGQRLALEREITLHTCPSILIIASHDSRPDQDIDEARCLVREYFEDGKWHTPKEFYTVKRKIDEFVAKYAPECLHL